MVILTATVLAQWLFLSATSRTIEPRPLQAATDDPLDLGGAISRWFLLSHSYVSCQHVVYGNTDVLMPLDL